MVAGAQSLSARVLYGHSMADGPHRHPTSTAAITLVAAASATSCGGPEVDKHPEARPSTFVRRHPPQHNNITAVRRRLVFTSFLIHKIVDAA